MGTANIYFAIFPLYLTIKKLEKYFLDIKRLLIHILYLK